MDESEVLKLYREYYDKKCEERDRIERKEEEELQIKLKQIDVHEHMFDHWVEAMKNAMMDECYGKKYNSTNDSMMIVCGELNPDCVKYYINQHYSTFKENHPDLTSFVIFRMSVGTISINVWFRLK